MKLGDLCRNLETPLAAVATFHAVRVGVVVADDSGVSPLPAAEGVVADVGNSRLRGGEG